jgi:hypothetical protein
MSTNFIWWSAVTLEVVILLRAALTGLLRKYPLFYSYIGCVLLKEVILLLTNQFAHNLYDKLYWPTELATIVASYAVIIEIFRWSTRHQPGLRRVAQNVLLTVFFLAVGYACSDFAQGGSVTVPGAILELGRDLRYVEGGVLLVMLGFLVHYRVSLGRNLLGLIVGYSFWVGINVVNLSLWFLPGNEFSTFLRAMLPATYLITLGIWCRTLWSAQTEAVQPSGTDIEREYKFLAGETKAVLTRTSSQVARIVKP